MRPCASFFHSCPVFFLSFFPVSLEEGSVSLNSNLLFIGSRDPIKQDASGRKDLVLGQRLVLRVFFGRGGGAGSAYSVFSSANADGILKAHPCLLHRKERPAQNASVPQGKYMTSDTSFNPITFL